MLRVTTTDLPVYRPPIGAFTVTLAGQHGEFSALTWRFSVPWVLPLYTGGEKADILCDLCGTRNYSMIDSDTRNGTPLLPRLYCRRAFLAIFRSISPSRSTLFISASANR